MHDLINKSESTCNLGKDGAPNRAIGLRADALTAQLKELCSRTRVYAD